MNIKSIINKIKENPQYKGGKDDKYLYGLVKERLFLSDYIKNNLNKTITEVNDDEDEVEIEPENIEIQKTPSSEEDQNDSEESPESEIPEKPETFEEPTEYEEPEESPEDFDEEPSSTTTSTPSSIPTSTIDDTEPEEEPEIVKPTPTTNKLKKKEPEDNGYIEISVDEARELLSYKGKIFTAVFTKRSNGELRALYGMTGVRKYTKGGELPYSPKEKNLIPVYDLKLGPGPEGYRTIPIEGLKALNINGRKYKINHALQEIKINKPRVSLEDVKSLKNILIKDLGVFSLSEEEMKIARSLGWKEDGNTTTKYFKDNPHLIPQLYSKLRKLKQDNIQENMKKDLLKKIVTEVILEIKKSKNLISKGKILKENKEADLKIYKSELNMLNKIKPTGDKQIQRKKYLEDKIKELEGNLQENQPSPQRQSPDREVIEKPETDTPERKPKRRTLTPPTESPSTRPKAEGVEKNIANKIADRFKKLKKQKNEHFRTT